MANMQLPCGLLLVFHLIYYRAPPIVPAQRSITMLLFNLIMQPTLVIHEVELAARLDSSFVLVEGR
jgi:hypothetical protein